MEVGGIDDGGGENALVLLALGFAEELLPPFGELPEMRFKGSKNFQVSSLRKELGAQAGVAEDGEVGEGLRGGGGFGGGFRSGFRGGFQSGFRGGRGGSSEGADESLALGGGTGEQRFNINPSGGEGEQADGAEDGVATADIIRDNEALIAFGDRFVVKSAMSGIGGGVDARLGGITVFGVKLGFEKAEGHGWFGGGAGFRDDVDGEVVVAEGGEEVGVGFGTERVAGVKQFHARSGAESFGEGTVAEVGAADTDTNEIFGGLLDFGGGCLDSGKLGAVVGLR